MFLTLNSLIDKVLHSSEHFILVSELCVENARCVEQHGDGGQVGHVAGGGHGQHSSLGRGWQGTETKYGQAGRGCINRFSWIRTLVVSYKSFAEMLKLKADV